MFRFISIAHARKVRALLLTISFVLLSNSARAVVYRCEGTKGVEFSGFGCAGARAVELRPLAGTVDALTPAEKARLAELARDAERRRAIDSQQARRTRTVPVQRASVEDQEQWCREQTNKRAMARLKGRQSYRADVQAPSACGGPANARPKAAHPAHRARR